MWCLRTFTCSALFALATWMLCSASRAQEPKAARPEAATGSSASEPWSWDLVPSLRAAGGGGVVVTPSVSAEALTELSGGVYANHSQHARGNGQYRPLWFLALHGGAALSAVHGKPISVRGEVTATFGRGFGAFFALAARLGPTYDTLGRGGFRSGISASLHSMVGVEAVVHHVFVADRATSVGVIMFWDLGIATSYFLNCFHRSCD